MRWQLEAAALPGQRLQNLLQERQLLQQRLFGRHMQASFNNDHNDNFSCISSDSNCHNDFDCLLACMADRMANRKLAERTDSFAWLKHAACDTLASFDNHTCDTAERWQNEKILYAVERRRGKVPATSSKRILETERIFQRKSCEGAAIIGNNKRYLTLMLYRKNTLNE